MLDSKEAKIWHHSVNKSSQGVLKRKRIQLILKSGHYLSCWCHSCQVNNHSNQSKSASTLLYLLGTNTIKSWLLSNYFSPGYASRIAIVCSWWTHEITGTCVTTNFETGDCICPIGSQSEVRQRQKTIEIVTSLIEFDLNILPRSNNSINLAIMLRLHFSDLSACFTTF